MFSILHFQRVGQEGNHFSHCTHKRLPQANVNLSFKKAHLHSHTRKMPKYLFRITFNEEGFVRDSFSYEITFSRTF